MRSLDVFGTLEIPANLMLCCKDEFHDCLKLSIGFLFIRLVQVQEHVQQNRTGATGEMKNLVDEETCFAVYFETSSAAPDERLTDSVSIILA